MKKLFREYKVRVYNPDGDHYCISVRHAEVLPDGTTIRATHADGKVVDYVVTDTEYPTLSVEIEAIGELAYSLWEQGYNSDDLDRLFEELPLDPEDYVLRIADEIRVAEGREPMETVNRTGYFTED